MSKRLEKAENELESISNGYREKWERLVVNNAGLHDEMAQLRARYGLQDLRGCAVAIRLEAYEAWGKTKVEDQQSLVNEVWALARKYSIPWHVWGDELVWMAVAGWPLSVSFPMGFARHTMTCDDQRKWHYSIQLPADAPVDNPIIRKEIRDNQVLAAEIEGIPGPVPDQRDPKKLDWRPVWEWEKTHPRVTRVRMAELLSYNRVTVCRALEELDAHLTGNK